MRYPKPTLYRDAAEQKEGWESCFVPTDEQLMNMLPSQVPYLNIPKKPLKKRPSGYVNPYSSIPRKHERAVRDENHSRLFGYKRERCFQYPDYDGYMEKLKYHEREEAQNRPSWLPEVLGILALLFVGFLAMNSDATQSVPNETWIVVLLIILLAK